MNQFASKTANVPMLTGDICSAYTDLSNSAGKLAVLAKIAE